MRRAQSLKRAVLERIGLLDERFFINYDDVDLSLRAGAAGYRVLYVPAARMWHKVSAAMGQASPATTYYMTRNALLLFRLHGRGLGRASAMARVFARTARTIGAWTLRPQYRDPLFRRKRDANLFALRDFCAGRFGKMGPDVARVCFTR